MSKIFTSPRNKNTMKPQLPPIGIFSDQDLIEILEKEHAFTPKSDDSLSAVSRPKSTIITQLLSGIKLVEKYKSKNEPFIVSIKEYQQKKYEGLYYIQYSKLVEDHELTKALLIALSLPSTTEFKCECEYKYELGIELRVLKDCLESLREDERLIIFTGLQLTIIDYEKAKLFQDVTNKFISQLHQQLNHIDIKKQFANRKKSFQKVNKKCLRLINQLFDQHSKLLVIRMDFAYRRNPNLVQPIMHPEDVPSSKDDLLKLKKQIKNFLDNKRHNKNLSEILGYILRFEYGLDKGFHVHALFFLNGQKHREDITWAKIFRDYWEKITKQQGCTYICNMQKEKYRHCGIGLLHYADKEKRQNLQLVVNYICKTDQFFWFSNLAGARSFQISQLPKTQSSKAGRPRHN